MFLLQPLFHALHPRQRDHAVLVVSLAICESRSGGQVCASLYVARVTSFPLSTTQSSNMKPSISRSLADFQWEWKQADSPSQDHWRKCSSFPTNIHHELRILDMIPDEGVELNERKLQWVGEKDWIFRTSFPTPSNSKDYSHVVLAFDGLDTIAKVTLNGSVILESDNMFAPQRVEVGEFLVDDVENVLEIYFTSAARVARERISCGG